ncbi:MAG: hypothetical protein MUO67_02680 [Anaerolineales bacterium]|nr:hypothetical protein [Anaerolineales bacterium]
MGNYSSSEFDNLHDLLTIFDNTPSDITRVLPDVFEWPKAVLYLLKALEVKAVELEGS